MKAWMLVAVTLFTTWIPAAGQDVVNNPATPPAADAGRVVTARQVWRIKDSGEGYLLINPLGVKLAADGSVLVADQKKILRFDANGKHLRTYAPSSAPDPFMFLGIDLTQDSVVAYQRFGQRAYIFNLETGAERTVDLPGGPRALYEFLAAHNGRLYFADSRTIFSYSLDGKREGLEISLATDWAEMSEGPAQRMVTAPARVARIGERELAVCSSFDYLVRRVELASGTIVNAFRRQYTPVKNVNENTRGLSPNKLDVVGLQSDGNRVWVFTSTTDQAKGRLVDVFDLNGRYLDNFYLKLGEAGTMVTVREFNGREAIAIERNPTGAQVSIVKYALASAADSKH